MPSLQIRHMPPDVYEALAARAKAPLHQLVRFYVDLSVAKQASLQGHVVRALTLLGGQAARAQEENAQLRKEIEALRAEVEALRSGGDPSPSGSRFEGRRPG